MEVGWSRFRPRARLCCGGLTPACLQRTSAFGARQADLEIADDRAKKARCEQSWSQRSGPSLTDWWELPECSSGRRRHIAELPLDLVGDGPGRSGEVSPAALAAYAAAPRACAPMWGMAAACPAALAAAAADGVAALRAAAPPAKRRRISPATSSSPQAKACVRAMASRGRLSPGASASNNHRTRCAQSAAHPATIRLSASLSVCGEPIR
jgi:hypothetical protein